MSRVLSLFVLLQLRPYIEVITVAVGVFVIIAGVVAVDVGSIVGFAVVLLLSLFFVVRNTGVVVVFCCAGYVLLSMVLSFVMMVLLLLVLLILMLWLCVCVVVYCAFVCVAVDRVAHDGCVGCCGNVVHDVVVVTTCCSVGCCCVIVCVAMRVWWCVVYVAIGVVIT